ncbi:MAG: EAL domain-containing protein [Algisphaera sp.]
MTSSPSPVQLRADELFRLNQNANFRRTDRLFAVLMAFQFVGGVVAAITFSPRTWAGTTSQTHIHVWGAVVLGGLIASLPIALALRMPGRALTRHVIACSQIMFSGLFIHLSGGRIETHFHIFGSLAFLGFYRDWRIFIGATLITTVDHLLRSRYWPESVFGVMSAAWWRPFEHAAWVVFEDIFLIHAAIVSSKEMRKIAVKRSELESSHATVEDKVHERTEQVESQKRQLNEINSTLENRVKERTSELEKAYSQLEEEIAQRAAIENRLRHDAFHDALTNLPNRTLLLDRVGQCIERSKRQDNYYYAVLFIDLDGFKTINDSLGHQAGDKLLIAMSHRLQTTLRDLDSVARPTQDTTARLGGDEFVILLDGLHQPEDAEITARRILKYVIQPFDINGREVVVGASIGIAAGSHHKGYDKPEDIIRDADTALYQAKSNDKGSVVQFNQKMLDAAMARLEIESDLRKAFDLQQLSVVYQPLVELSTGKLSGFEALMRWHHPQKGWIPPDRFIPIAEEIGLIQMLGQWILEEACRQCQQWRTLYPQWSELRMSVNLSMRQLNDATLLTTLDDALSKTQLPPDNLCLEVTESMVMDNPEAVCNTLDNIRGRRVSVHLDDFGTGYSSLSCLHRLPLDAVKIDRTFIRDMALDEKHASTVQAIVTLAHTRGFKVIVEGIESNDQLTQLRAFHCDLGQGYYFAKPLTQNDAEQLLHSNHPWLTTQAA